VNIYPADERRISDVERGRSCRAILPVPLGQSLSAGDSILFALALSPAESEPCYVKDGDSVRVLLTDVAHLEAADPTTGKALFQLTWEPLGQPGTPATATRRRVKAR